MTCTLLTPASATLQWTDKVDFARAVDLLSTNQQLALRGWTLGTNARPMVDTMTADQCDSRAHGAWMANERERYVAYRSLAALKRAEA